MTDGEACVPQKLVVGVNDVIIKCAVDGASWWKLQVSFFFRQLPQEGCFKSHYFYISNLCRFVNVQSGTNCAMKLTSLRVCYLYVPLLALLAAKSSSGMLSSYPIRHSVYRLYCRCEIDLLRTKPE